MALLAREIEKSPLRASLDYHCPRWEARKRSRHIILKVNYSRFLGKPGGAIVEDGSGSSDKRTFGLNSKQDERAASFHFAWPKMVPRKVRQAIGRGKHWYNCMLQTNPRLTMSCGGCNRCFSTSSEILAVILPTQGFFLAQCRLGGFLWCCR